LQDSPPRRGGCAKVGAQTPTRMTMFLMSNPLLLRRIELRR
jgi:hypothetical protein